jgi:hypothetical protein
MKLPLLATNVLARGYVFATRLRYAIAGQITQGPGFASTVRNFAHVSCWLLFAFVYLAVEAVLDAASFA